VGVCFISVPAVSGSVTSIVEPKQGIFGDEVIITVVSDAGLFSPAQILLFINEGNGVVERVPVTVVSSTTVYASISKLDIEPGMYTLALDIGAAEPLLLNVSFRVQSSEMEEVKQKKPLIEVRILETIEPIIDEVEIDLEAGVKKPLIDVMVLEMIPPNINQIREN